MINRYFIALFLFFSVLILLLNIITKFTYTDTYTNLNLHSDHEALCYIHQECNLPCK